MTYVWLALAAAAAWIISTLAGGGGALLLVPVIQLLIGPKATAPIITIILLMNQPARALIMRDQINWRIVAWFLPAAIAGAIAGSWVFASVQAHWLQLVVGLFLVSTIVQYRFGQAQSTFPVKTWYFLPAGFGFSFLSGLIGSTGPILNPLYLNMKLKKEEMVATKSAAAVGTNIVKIVTYFILGAITWQYLWYGLVAGAAALATNWIARRWLQQLSGKVFRLLVIAIMVLSGLMMIWRQHGVLVQGWHALFG